MSNLKVKLLNPCGSYTACIFCFHHCGGDGGTFRDLGSEMNGVAAFSIILPGRAKSQAASCHTSMTSLADIVLSRLREEMLKKDM